MRRNLFESAMQTALRLVALIVILTSGVWAQPKFKILATVPGGLFGGVTFDATGNLYGTTTGGGDHNDGTIFELSPGAHGWSLTTLHSFDGYDGGSPNGGLIFDATGNVYGTTPSGGTGYDGGTIFEMTPASGGWAFKVLYDFCTRYHCPDGSASEAGLILDKAGSLYGTTTAGGVYGHGTVFELAPNSSEWVETPLYSFCSEAYCRDGWAPYSALILDKAGNLYGTTFSGGAHGDGSVFRLGRSSGGVWKESLPDSFRGYDGQGPLDGVVFDGSGNLYGTTRGGGGACEGEFCGVVFRLARGPHGRWEETVLYGFLEPAYGFYPSSGLVFDKGGNLYGTTAQGGGGPCYDGCGVVYKLSLGANGKWRYSILHKFSDASGGLPPSGDLVFDEEGNLYGTAYNVVFEITP